MLQQGGKFRLSYCPKFLFAAMTSMSQDCNIGNEKCLHNNQTLPHLTLSSWRAINYQRNLQRWHGHNPNNLTVVYGSRDMWNRTLLVLIYMSLSFYHFIFHFSWSIMIKLIVIWQLTLWNIVIIFYKELHSKYELGMFWPAGPLPHHKTDLNLGQKFTIVNMQLYLSQCNSV